ncbi:MAG: hypothetical protein L0191_17620, partial [Acidobacteria bacterium]|nr:hypothetical protein [Acidobacteriota bacterium]
MMRRHAARVVLALMAATLLGAAPPPQLVAQWSSPADTGQKFQKILAIGITDDRQLRHRFEDNVVTHLRGKDIQAVTSYSLVPDLKAPGSREEVLQKIEAQKIDAALSFRAVPLEKSDEAAWDAAWMREAEGTGTRTGEPPSVEELRGARQGAGAIPILIGSGLSASNARTLLQAADG